jgi:DNA-binding CsgD family transcriptional regulator
MLVKIDLKRKDHKLALYRLDGLMKVHESLLRPLQKLTVLELYMQAFKLSGNKSKYEFYLKQWIALTKTEATLSIDANQNLTEILSANALEEITIQIENEKQLLSQQLVINKQESRLQKWVLIAGSLFIILVTFFFLSRYRKSALLKDTLLKLANKEQDFLKLKVQEESRNVKLLSHELMIKQDFSKKIIDKLDQIEGINKPTLKKIEFFIDNELDVKSTRALVQKRMGDLSSSFYANLNIKHDKLTDLELKLASMVVMKMSNKEIAISRGITLESSKKAKNRLKKKLGAPADGELLSYLNRFL